MKRKRRRAASEGEQGSGTTGRAPEVDGWLPSWAPFVAFGVIAAFLFREFIVSRGMLFGTDVVSLGYFARHFYAEMMSEGTFPLWNPFVFGGLPFVDAMHGDIFYPTTILKFVMPVHRAMGWKLVLHIFLAGTFTYFWLRHLQISRSVSAWGGIAYMLAPVLVTLIYPGHDGKLFVSALTPLALWMADGSVTRGGAWRFAALALVVALLIFTAHMQLAYFATWAIGAVAIYRLVERKRAGGSTGEVARRFGGVITAGVAGALLIGAVQLWAPVRYLTTYSQRVAKTTEAEEERGYAYSTSWSLHAEEAFSLVVPEFVGANRQSPDGVVNTYWGRNSFKLNHEYAGFLPLLLLPLAFFSRRRRGEAWLFTGIAVGCLIYALGATTPLFYLFYWLVPGVKLFRAPSSIMFIFAVAAITAAALGLDGVEEGEDAGEREAKTQRVAKYLWGTTAVFLLLALLGAAGVFTDLWVSALYSDIGQGKAAALDANLPNIQQGLWITFLLSGLVAGGWHLYRRGQVPRPVWVGALALLAVLDPLRVDPGFIQVVDPARIYPRDDVTDYLVRQDAGGDPFRVFTLPQGGGYQTNQFAFFGVEELTGHHGNEIGRYMDLVDFQQHPEGLMRVLRLLNTRYLVSGQPIQAPGLVEAFRGRRAIVYELAGTYPRAFLVPAYEVVDDTAALDRLLDPAFDPARNAVLERAPEIEPQPDAQGRTRWIEREINRQTVETETTGAMLLVVGDNYYPSWQVEIDGEPAELLRADHTLRAVAVPAGTHEVRFYYRSPLYRAAALTTLFSLVAAAALIAVAVWRWRRQSTGAVTEEPGR